MSAPTNPNPAIDIDKSMGIEYLICSNDAVLSPVHTAPYLIEFN